MIYKQLKSLLDIPRGTVYIFFIYSILLGILSLTIPISVQTLVNLVNVSISTRPIISLTIILFVLLTTAFCIRIFQIYLVEHIERRLFVNLSVKILEKINKIRFYNFTNINVAEKVNRAFELPMLQKSVSIIFITLLDIVLQIIFCVIILGFYHPLFLTFDILLVTLVFLSLFLPFFSACKTAYAESTCKYEIVAWFEELANNPISFRQANNADLSLKILDKHLCDYIGYRKKHFGFLLRHHIYIGITYILINIALLSLGSYLIIKGQLSIGQLIAAELLINVVLVGMLKFSYYLDDCYDFIVGAIKIKQLFEISELEKIEKLSLNVSSIDRLKILDKDIELNVSFKNKNIEQLVLDKESTNKICLSLLDGNKFESFSLYINDHDLSIYDQSSLNEKLILIRNIELYDAKVIENIKLGQLESFKVEFLKEVLVKLDLEYLEEIFYERIDSQIVKYKIDYNDQVILMILRAIMMDPKLILIVDVFYFLNTELQNKIINLLNELKIPTIIIRQGSNVRKSEIA
ncbi:ATP-binding cassette domain-containing protein [Francisella frigiditurris]|uniref:Putative membrane protein n=1 Tax=Francisella frigiditurris TaxID=1542390 RepID=A0A1J0KTU9_9GAMM|nr:hypothetical protein [Francisella frigiditurris]APC97208.1 putative membrane protein [Francisella frigiditurris]